MTVSATALRATFFGDGVQTVFAYPFKIFDATQILVQLEDLNNVITVQVLTTDYTVSGVGNETGGSVTFIVAPLSTDTVILTLNIPLAQQTAYPEGGRFPAQAHEDALDELTLIAQQQQEQMNRAFTVSIATPATVDTTVPDPSSNANDFLRINATGNGYIYSDITGLGSVGIPVIVAQGGTGTITGSMTLVAGAARNHTVAENATVAGDNFTTKAGDAAQAGTDINGGTLLVQAGSSEGTGFSQVEIYAAKAGLTGSVQNVTQLATRFTAEAIAIQPHGTGAGNTGELRFLELAASGTDFTGFKAPDTLTGNILYTLPAVASTGTQIMQSDVSNVLSWVDNTVAASQAQQETATDLTTFVSPGRQQFHPSASKVWVKFNGIGVVAIDDSYNVSSITDNAVGDYTINFTVAFSSDDYAFAGDCRLDDAATSPGNLFINLRRQIADQAAGSFRVVTANSGGGLFDAISVWAVMFGDQ